MPPSSTATPTVVELAPQLFLTLDGRVLRDAPMEARVIRGTVGAFAGSAPVVTGLVPLGGGGGQGGAQDPSLWDVIATSFKLKASLKQSIEHALQLVGGIASIVGAVGAVASLLEMSGILGTKTTLDDVLKAVWRNYAATLAASKLDHLRSIANHVGVAEGAAAAVTTFRQLPGTRASLVSWEQPLSAACMALSDRAFQRVIFNPGEYVLFPWFWEWGWLDVPDFVTSGLPLETEPVLRMVDHPSETDRFDYRFVLGAVIFAVTVRVAMMHALEPEFRSTGRYRAELQRLCSRMRVLLHQWLQCVQWSWNPKDDLMAPVSTWPLSGPPPSEDYVPVGAVDVCSGYAVWTARYVPEWNPNAPMDQPEFWAQPYLSNAVPSLGGGVSGPLRLWPPEVRARYYHNADARRAAARQAVLDESGYLAFAAYVTSLCALTTDPDASETVAISPRWVFASLFPSWWHRAGTEERVVGGLFCERRVFEAEIWEAAAHVSLNVRTQTSESRTTFPIPYRYFLAAGATRVELTPGQNETVTVQAEHFIAERGLGGEARDVPTSWAPVTITYGLKVEPGHTTVDLHLSPAAGNVSVQLLVEETIQSGRVFQTSRDVSLVTREHRLPTAYFEHLAECQRKADRLLGELNRRFAISAAAGPRFDPRQYTAAEYLTVAQREAPEVFKAALARVVGPQ